MAQYYICTLSSDKSVVIVEAYREEPGKGDAPERSSNLVGALDGLAKLFKEGYELIATHSIRNSLFYTLKKIK